MKTNIFSKKLIFFTALTLSLAVITSCKKMCKDEEPDNSNNVLLQPQNSFSCLLNGVEYVPKGKGFQYAYNYVQYSKNDGGFGFFTQNLKDFFPEYVFVYFNIKTGLFSEGIYTDILDVGYDLQILNKDTDVSQFYNIDTSANYQIEVTKFDLDKSNIAGSFRYTAVSEDKSDTIQVTEGKFDIYNIIINE